MCKQLLADHHTRDGLRRLDHRQHVELLGGHARWSPRSGRPGLDEPRVTPLDVAHLAVGAPAQVAVARLAQVGVGDQREPARAGRSARRSRRRSPRCGRSRCRAPSESLARTGARRLRHRREAARARRPAARRGSRNSRGSSAPRSAFAGGARRAPAGADAAPGPARRRAPPRARAPRRSGSRRRRGTTSPSTAASRAFAAASSAAP